jgi:hypothetical protein
VKVAEKASVTNKPGANGIGGAICTRTRKEKGLIKAVTTRWTSLSPVKEIADLLRAILRVGGNS